MKNPTILNTECHPSEIHSICKLLRPLHYAIFSIYTTLFYKMNHLPSLERIRYLQAHTTAAYVHCLSVNVNIFTNQTKPDMLTRSMPICSTHIGDSLCQIHAAFTVFNPNTKYSEIEWIFKYGYALDSYVVKPVTDVGWDDDRFIAGCQSASDTELPTEEVKTLPLLYILYCDHEITAENRAGTGYIPFYTINGTCYISRYNISLVTVVMKES